MDGGWGWRAITFITYGNAHMLFLFQTVRVRGHFRPIMAILAAMSIFWTPLAARPILAGLCIVASDSVSLDHVPQHGSIRRPDLGKDFHFLPSNRRVVTVPGFLYKVLTQY